LKGFGGTRKVYKILQKTRRGFKPIIIPETPGLDGLPRPAERSDCARKRRECIFVDPRYALDASFSPVHVNAELQRLNCG
jgi:hypothetical protein